MDSILLTTQVLAILALTISVVGIVIAVWSKVAKNSEAMAVVKTDFDNLHRRTDSQLEKADKMLIELQNVTVESHHAPELTAYLAHQWDFLEKTFHRRFAKHNICRRIVDKHLGDHRTILLDSGSTIDLVTYELLGTAVENINIYTNNVFAAIHLVGVKNITLHLLQGVFSHRFAASYSQEANARLSDLGVTFFVVAATSISFEAGIMADAGDRGNLEFKAAALRAFKETPNASLIIAVDGEKFLQGTAKHKGVLSESEWEMLLKTQATSITLVTSDLPDDVDRDDRVCFDNQVNQFREAGVDVDTYMKSKGLNWT